MKTNDRELKRYYRQIREILPCTRRAKDTLERQIRCNVEAFLAENPETDFPTLRSYFGEPEAVAAAYIELADTKELLKQFSVRQKIFRLVVCLVVILLLSWSGVILYALQEARTGDEFAVIELKEGEVFSFDQVTWKDTASGPENG